MPKGRAPSVVIDSRSAGGPVETVWSLMAELKAQQGLPAAMCTPSAPRIQAAAILPEAKGARGAPLRPPLRRPRAVQPEGVPLDVFDAAGVLGDSREASLVAASAVGVLAAAHDGAVPPKSVAEEVARHQAVAALSRRFSELCEERLGKKWYTHFEAWLLSRRAAEAAANGGAEPQDPCVPAGPTIRKDAELARKMTAAGASGSEAAAACDTLGRAAAKAVAALRSVPTPVVPLKVKVENITVGRDEIQKTKLTCNGVRVEVNRVHYWKLRALFERHNRPDPTERRAPKGKGKGKSEFRRRFDEAAFCLLARYSSLQGTHYRGGGFQAAIHSECFDVLREEMGVRVECFASPLNSRWPRFCSAFLDTDAPFGSLGSFFKLYPEQGSFEANPPFDNDIIWQMEAHMDQLLITAQRSNKPLSFVVIIPEQKDKSGWTRVSKNQYLTHHLLLVAGTHGYKEGAQHNRANTHRTACHNTSVFFLQSAAGARKWPVTDGMLLRLKAAFATKAPPAREKPAKKVKEPGGRSLWGDSPVEAEAEGSDEEEEGDDRRSDTAVDESDEQVSLASEAEEETEKAAANSDGDQARGKGGSRRRLEHSGGRKRGKGELKAVVTSKRVKRR